MLREVLVQQSLFELVNGFSRSIIGQPLEPFTEQRCSQDVVALRPCQPALRLLYAGELFLLPVKLPDAPSQAALCYIGINACQSLAAVPTPEGSFCGVVVGPKTSILPFFTSIRSIKTTRSSPVSVVLAW